LDNQSSILPNPLEAMFVGMRRAELFGRSVQAIDIWDRRFVSRRALDPLPAMTMKEAGTRSSKAQTVGAAVVFDRRRVRKRGTDQCQAV
jgi:hypothetical protein